MEYYSKSKILVQAIQVQFPIEKRHHSFFLDTYIQEQLTPFFKSLGYQIRVSLWGAKTVELKSTKNLTEKAFSGMQLDCFSCMLRDKYWIVVDETQHEKVKAYTESEFKDLFESVEPYLEEVEQMVSEERPAYGFQQAIRQASPKEEWLFIKQVGDELIEGTQLTPEKYMLKITNEKTKSTSFITENGKVPTN